MPRPYSQDLRDRVVGAVEAGSSARAAGACVWGERIDGSEVGSTLAPDGDRGGEADGRLRPLAAGGSRPRWYWGFIAERPDLTIEEVRAALRGAGHWRGPRLGVAVL